jgi:hypothetical protein
MIRQTCATYAAAALHAQPGHAAPSFCVMEKRFVPPV